MRVLIIDDDAFSRDILKVRLEGAGYETAEAANGEEGVRLARELGPDLIVMDVMMPKVDGWLACRILKSEAKTKAIPIILLTARSQRLEELRGWESGADEYLAKPCDARLLLDSVARFLGRASGGRA